MAEDMRPCEWCGKQFRPTRKNSKYCSPGHGSHAANARRKPLDIPPQACENCGEEFRPVRRTQRFCSPDCGRDAHNVTRRRPRVGEEQRAAMELLEREGYIVHKPRPDETETVDLDPDLILGTGRVKLGVVSDTHFGSIYQQVTYLQEFYAYCASEGVETMIHCGDVTDGPFERHKNPHEVFLHDWQALRDYAAAKLPDIQAPQYVISGNHDDWFMLGGGADIVESICDKRDDLTYVGRSSGFVTIGPLTIELFHPHDGSAYAYSYKPQKHVEALSPANKPNISLIGNYHKFNALDYRNVWTIQLPSFQSQSSFMRQKSLVSEVGGVILDVGLHPKGLAPSVKFEAVFYREPLVADYPKAA